MLEARWQEIAERCDALPHTLVDADFVSKNLGHIVTALRWSLIVGCDMALLKRGWLEYLIARSLRPDVEMVMGGGLFVCSGEEPPTASSGRCAAARP
jgi:hypothetical protein